MAPKPRPKPERQQQTQQQQQQKHPAWRLPVVIMTVSALVLAASVAIGVSPWTALAQGSPAVRPLPSKAQIIDQRKFNVLEEVGPPAEANATTASLPLPGHDMMRRLTFPRSSFGPV